MALPSTLETIAAGRTAQAAAGRAGAVTAAIRDASARTGVNFAYLMEKAAVESGMRPDAKAATSSATGLFQFIDSTWLDTLKKHGAAHGLGRYADAIAYDGAGRPRVGDAALRREILDLRRDPRVSALMVAEYTKDNQDYLAKSVGGEIGSTELYLAHFLGPQGATRFLTGMRRNPDQAGAEILPEAAAANRGIFYRKESGRPTTLREIYQRFAQKFQDNDADGILADWRSATRGGSLDRVLKTAPTGADTGASSGVGTAGTGTGADGAVAGGLTITKLSAQTALALAALELPTEDSRAGRTALGTRRIRSEATGGTADNEFRRQWHRDESAA